LRFILRQITRRAGGGDIVRSRMLAADEPVIGRGSDCDIQLADLAVSLRHAKLKEAGPGRVAVEALGTAQFELNGAFVTRAEVSLDKSPTLGFGDHLITLKPGDEAGEALVVVAARENVAVRRDDAFSLKSALFSQRRIAWIALATILLFCLALPIGQFFLAHNPPRITGNGAARRWLSGQWSSGALSPGHHFLEQNCEACHRDAFVAVRDETCLSCHRADLDQAARLGLASDMRQEGSPLPPRPVSDHAPADRLRRAAPSAAGLGWQIGVWFSRPFDHPDSGCASCHIEHAGTGAGPLSGKPPPITLPELARMDCAGCHDGITHRLPDTKIPDVADWGHHPDFRPLITVGFANGTPRLERIALAARPSENSGLRFSHQDHLNAAGGVARMAEDLKAQGYGAPLTCANCHHADTTGQGFLPIEMTRDCSQCHTLAFAGSGNDVKLLPHGYPDEVVAALRSFYESQAGGNAAGFNRRPGDTTMPQTISVAERVAAGVRQAFGPGGTCYECHTVIPPENAASLAFNIAPVHLMDRYLPDGAFDHNLKQHRQDTRGAPSCETCHKAGQSSSATDVLLPRIADCDTCHGKSKNQAQMAAGADCAECHGFHDTGKPTIPLVEAAKE
jgi:hypothetical protein